MLFHKQNLTKIIGFYALFLTDRKRIIFMFEKRASISLDLHSGTLNKACDPDDDEIEIQETNQVSRQSKY